MKSILVTTDLSPAATRAYALAAECAQKFDAALTLATFIDSSIHFGVAGPFDVPVAYIPESMEEVVKRTREELERQIAQYLAGLKVSSVVQETPGPVHHGIVEYIESSKPDLVVMSSHGRSGLARTLMGSVTEQVLRRTSKPVLVVPVRE